MYQESSESEAVLNVYGRARQSGSLGASWPLKPIIHINGSNIFFLCGFIATLEASRNQRTGWVAIYRQDTPRETVGHPAGLPLNDSTRVSAAVLVSKNLTSDPCETVQLLIFQEKGTVTMSYDLTCRFCNGFDPD
ncbi:MAG: hypothetical protein V1853_02255 [bacterium]